MCLLTKSSTYKLASLTISSVGHYLNGQRQELIWSSARPDADGTGHQAESASQQDGEGHCSVSSTIGRFIMCEQSCESEARLNT